MRSERTPVGGTFITTFLKTLSFRDRENKEAGSRDPRAEGFRDRENIMHHEPKAHISHESKASKFHGDRQNKEAGSRDPRAEGFRAQNAGQSNTSVFAFTTQ